MWLRLSLGVVGTSPLAALVASDGQLYWRVLDIARVLGKRNAYQFATRVVGTLRGKDVLTVAAEPRTLRCRLLTTQQAYRLLLRKDQLLAHAFDRALESGCRARVTPPAQVGRLSHQCSPLLSVDEQGDVSVDAWIREYTALVLDADVSMLRDGSEMESRAEEQRLPEAPEADTWIPKGVDASLRPIVESGKTQRGERVMRQVHHHHDRELPREMWVMSGNRMKKYIEAEP